MHGCRLFAVCLALTACADSDKTPGEWSSGKGDGAFELVEVGPAPLDGHVEVALDQRVPAYRVESYGGTKLTIDVKGRGGSDAYVIVEGPLPGDGDRIAIGAGTIVDEDDDSGYGRDAKLALELAQPGVYRILAGTYESLGAGGAATGTITVAVTCSANCYRPLLDQKSFVRSLPQQAGFLDYAKAELASLVHDPVVAERMAAQLSAILADRELTGLERFPTIPLSALGTLRQ